MQFVFINHRKNKRNHQHETGFIKQGDAYNKANEYQCPLNVFNPKKINQYLSDFLSGPAICHQLAYHGPYANNDGYFS